MTKPTDISRRGFLGASIVAGAGAPLLGCSEKAARYIIPRVIPPDDAIPGKALSYRSVCRECDAGCGLDVRVRDARAVKLEGNPDHPINRGALCPVGQAAIDGLYSPDRLRGPLARGPGGALAPVSWDVANERLAEGLRSTLAAGRGVAVVTRPETGFMGAMLGDWLMALGQTREQLVTIEPAAARWQELATAAVFGATLRPVYDIEKAELLVSIGDDFVEGGASPVEHARGLGAMRGRGSGRFVYVGPRLSLTAGAADEWLSVTPGAELHLVLGLARVMLDEAAPGVADLSPEALQAIRTALAPFDPQKVGRRTGLPAADVETLGRDLARARPGLCIGPGTAVAGGDAVALAAAVHLVNALAGSTGDTVRYYAVEGEPGALQPWSLADLARRVTAGEVGAIVVHQANPLDPNAVPSKQVRDALAGAPFLAVLGHRLDATAQGAHLVLADHHPLESWATVKPRPGVTGLQQPAMTPLHDTRAAGDVLLAAAAALEKAADLPSGSYGENVQNEVDVETIQRGGVFEPSEPVEAVVASDPFAALSLDAGSPPPSDNRLAVVPFPSVRFIAGRADAGDLLQDIPDPLTTISWSEWVELHPRTAARVGATTGMLVKVETDAGSLEVPAYVHPGVREDVVAVPAVFSGPLFVERVGADGRAVVRGLGRTARLPLIEGSADQQGRGLAREVPASDPRIEADHHGENRSMYPEHEHTEHRWGLAIDLDRCTGCNACVTACAVENNMPIAGPADAVHGRRMAWIRMDRFFETGDGTARMRFLPMMCQQCCNAPCESVCPVYATYHHPEGINAQIYNRCVGTRYCENNCPFHARRFNWWDHEHTWPRNLRLNPDVTVRERGVTEKCTLCYQRIRLAKEDAKAEGRDVRDGEIKPACAQTCPTDAIVFGDLNDPESRVSKRAAHARSYRLLEHLNVEPGVHYLARIRRSRDG